ncbi:MAG: Rid family detoxifying hydrolase [Woeseiaceae bacterium]|nr:Rid family detoxifying hydrolase [Woeseiaceae bacterium]
MKRLLGFFVTGIALTLCGVATAGGHNDVEFIVEPGAEDMPFSAAVRVGNLLFVSGAIGYDRETQSLVEGGIGPETKKTLETIQATLEANGSSMNSVVKCTVFLADIAEWAAMNEVYVTFFDNKPARSALGVNGLALGARVEIECIGVVD